MCGFVEILSVQRQPKTNSDTRSEFDVIRESSNASIVDFGLVCELIWEFRSRSGQSNAYLGKGRRVKTIFACHFHADVIATF